jgi:quercetin dioxygenase-like cupin family protein
MQAAAVRRFPHVPAGSGEAYNVIGELLTFKVTGAETNGTFTVVELLAQPGGGPPLHTHPSAESFTILEGEFEFTGLDDGRPYSFRARPGDTVFIPGGAPHTYQAVGETPAKTMLVLTPGVEMERFFAEAGVRVTPGQSVPSGPPDIPALLATGQKHGLVFLGLDR